MGTHTQYATDNGTGDIGIAKATLATFLTAFATGCVGRTDDTLDMQIDESRGTVRLYAVSTGSTRADDFLFEKTSGSDALSVRRIREDSARRKPFQVSFLYSLASLTTPGVPEKLNR